MAKKPAKPVEQVQPATDNLINRQELIDLLAEKTPAYSKKQIAETLSALIDTVKEQTTAGKEIRLVGFGSFKQVEKAARQGHNPKTGEKIKISARKAVIAKLSSKWAVKEI